MALYRIHFLDYGGNIYSTHNVEHEDDEAAIEAAHDLNVLPRLGRFEVWEDDRLCKEMAPRLICGHYWAASKFRPDPAEA
jgi:hypothetical protein